MFEFLDDIGNYEDRKIGRTEINNVIVSTAFTSDEGYETAIIDKNGVHPVERYSTREEAESGHGKWCKEAESIEKVLKLGGFGGIIENEWIFIER